MYHPGKYQAHNQSLDKFCELFNQTAAKLGKELAMIVNRNENFKDDGCVAYLPAKKKILYDWEKRDRYYQSHGFPFEDFGQFERKIQKPEIFLSIQAAKNEEAFCIAWHNDFRKEAIKHIGSVTENGSKEYNGKRFTKKFKELRYNEMDTLYYVLLKAFQEKKFDYRCF